MYGHIQIVLNYLKKVDNVIPTQERHVAFGYTFQVGVIKTTGNIRISPSSNINRDVWAKPIIFIGI